MLKNKLPSFVIADNPMTDPPRTFIIHLRHPVMVAEVNPDHPDELTGVWNEPAPEWDEMQWAKLMRRMGDWYIAYCNWEDRHVM